MLLQRWRQMKFSCGMNPEITSSPLKIETSDACNNQSEDISQLFPL